MFLIDFLFYYTAIFFEKLNIKYGIRRLERSEGARNLIFISTFIWFLYVNSIYNLIVFKKVDYSVPWYCTLIISFFLYEALTIVYIKRKRFQMIFEREQSSEARFKISEKTGIIISYIYVFSGMAGLIVGALIYHFIVYGI